MGLANPMEGTNAGEGHFVKCTLYTLPDAHVLPAHRLGGMSTVKIMQIGQSLQGVSGIGSHLGQARTPQEKLLKRRAGTSMNEAKERYR